MAISILNYYEQPDGKNLMIMADDLYERNPGEAPNDNMPMDPTNYAISQNLGVPANGSITIVRDFDENKKVKTVANVFKDGEWKDAAEGGGSGEVKTGYINITKGEDDYSCDIDEALEAIEENDMVLINYGTYKALIVGVGIPFGTMSCAIPTDGGSDGFNIKWNSKIIFTENGEKINKSDKITKLFDFLLTKNIYPVYSLYTIV